MSRLKRAIKGTVVAGMGIAMLQVGIPLVKKGKYKYGIPICAIGLGLLFLGFYIQSGKEE